MLVASTQKQKRKEKRNDSEERKKNKRTIVPAMNHHPKNGQKGDPEFSTEKVSKKFYLKHIHR